MEKNSEAVVFLEDVYLNKTSIGAAPVFDKQSLYVKKNASGVMGVHAARDFKARELIISIERDGTLNDLRAFEEAQGMLSALGADKHFMDKEVLIALAVYKRYLENNQTDILFSTVDVKNSYINTPMAVSKRVEFIEFLYPNDKVLHLSAEFFETSIRNIGLDLDFFCLCYAYVRSRVWSAAGLLPGLDAFNASHGATANAYFCENFYRKYCYYADKDIKAGEEITWNYNQTGALATFVSYGYIDQSRQYRCDVDIGLEPDEIKKFVNVYTKCLDAARRNVELSGDAFFDIYKYSFTLICPGPKIEVSSKISEIKYSKNSYYFLRANVRVKLIAKENLEFSLFSPHDYENHIGSYGIEFEVRCIETMLNALEQTRNKCEERIKKFREGLLGSQCDIQPICDIWNYAYDNWERCLILIKKLIVAKNADEASLLISEHSGQKTDVDSLKSFLDRTLLESPQLELVLAKEILSEKRFI